MSKREFRDFKVDIYGLSNKAHDYHFEIDNSLFHLFEQDIVTSGSGTCDMVLEKSETMITLTFRIEAKVVLTCDVTLKPFDHQIGTEREMLIKFGEEEQELSDEIVVVPWDTKSINVAEYVYQFLLLEIPMKKVHPDLEKDRPDVLYVSEAEEPEEKEPIDPRWEALKKLK